MIQVIENGFISEPELVDFIVGFKKLVKGGVLFEGSFKTVMENLEIKIGENGEIILDENNIYILSE